MAKLTVKYTVIVYEDIDWPDDEMEFLNYESLLTNLDIEKSTEYTIEEIITVQKDDKEFYFD